MKRRVFLKTALAATAGLALLRFAIPRWLRPGPIRPLSGQARKLVDRALSGLDMGSVWDGHVHLIGVEEGGNGCAVNPAMRSHLHPVLRFQFDAFKAGSGIEDMETADRDYLERLLALHRNANPAGRLVLLGFDHQVDRDGTEKPGRSPFYVPNDYVLGLAERYPEIEACVSIHPYRQDAVERLDQAVEQGAVGVKWLPNAQGIDPSDKRCYRFYRRMAELGIPLLTHAGHELSVDSAFQTLGNPLHLRRALDHGVKVIVAHCASFGKAEGRPAFDLFMGLFRDPRYEGLLFGDLAAATLVNRAGRPLRELLAAPDLHHRLINGSDYPLPAFGVMIRTGRMVRQGLLLEEEAQAIDEIQRSNPLLADLVLKRCLRLERDGVVHHFHNVIFHNASRLFRGFSGTATETKGVRSSPVR
jgi:mannonate dehydratase